MKKLRYFRTFQAPEGCPWRDLRNNLRPPRDYLLGEMERRCLDSRFLCRNFGAMNF